MPQRPVVPSSNMSVISALLASSLASGGTITLTYPNLQPGTLNPETKGKGHFFGVGGHQVATQNSVYTYPKDFELTFNAHASGITLTWRGATLLAGTTLKVQLNELGTVVRAYGVGNQFGGNYTQAVGDFNPGVYLLNLGSPKAKSTTAVAAAQAVAGAANLTLNGASATGGVVYFDVPRAVDIVSSNVGDTTQTATVTGTDIYGNTLVETITFNGTTRVLGKKAFFKITTVRVSAVMAGNASVGNVDILGLPVFLPAAGYIVKELESGALATAGTTVAGAVLTPTATTADVRGTYLPNAACDGTKALNLLVWLTNPGDIGGTQFAG